MFIVTIENTTGTDILTRSGGQNVPAGNSLVIPEKLYSAYSEGANGDDADLVSDINSGDIVIAVNGVNLDNNTALRFLQTLDFGRVYSNGVLETFSPSLNFSNKFTLSTESVSGIVDVDVNDNLELSIKGSLFQETYHANSTNQWLDRLGEEDFNETPKVLPTDARLIAIDWSNERDGADVDIEFYVASRGSGSSNSLAYTWAIRGSRVASIYNENGLFTLNHGDKFAIFIRDRGGNALDSFVTSYFQSLGTVFSNSYTEDFSGDF